VKELVENSLDAGSTQISIEVNGGGVGLIRVVDNGAGIPAAEVELAFARHATSKLVEFDDLAKLSSLGFRGEALPSISAVAEVEMITCTEGESAGTSLSLRDGVIVNRGSRGRSRGTTITVGNLFRKLPARLKFLKSLATENSHIANVVSQYALAFPEVKFILQVDGRVTLTTPGSGKLIDSLVQVYGLAVARDMLEIGDSGWQDGASVAPPGIDGMISAPSLSRSQRGYLSFFVNRRWVNSRLLARAVEEAYHGLLMSGKYPIAVINVSLSPEEIDANIHPTKTELKFSNERLVFVTVQKAVRQTLIKLAPVPRIEEVAVPYKSSLPAAQVSWLPIVDANRHAGAPAAAPLTPAVSLPALRVLGQLFSSYIIAEGPDGLYIIDQHAAHERIGLEKIKQQWAQQKIEIQGLLEPVTFEVSPRQQEVMRAYHDKLAEFGFSVEPFGSKTYLVRAVPAMLAQRDWSAMLKELLDSLSSGDKGDDWREKMAISIACHSAIKAGQVLTSDEMRELIRQLEQAAIPHTCPHGRPTLIHLGAAQLNKEFGRS